jgi:hypothetical protein
VRREHARLLMFGHEGPAAVEGYLFPFAYPAVLRRIGFGCSGAWSIKRAGHAPLLFGLAFILFILWLLGILGSLAIRENVLLMLLVLALFLFVLGLRRTL